MNITHFGHACVLVETPGPAKDVRILLDPGTYSPGFEDLRELDLILITHAHPDHLDIGRLQVLLEQNPTAELVHSAGASGALGNNGGFVAESGDSLNFHGIEISVIGGEHACIHPDLPCSDNNGYLIAGTLLHPGDAFSVPPGQIDTLLIPIGGPWMKISESIDYLREVKPRVAVAIHQAGLAPVHQQMHCQLLKNLGPTETEIVVLEHAVAHTLWQC
ncbi:MBL fold metallo-hydrolase [Rhodococcus erythropolis]|nr:MBL fold metallo-hydrolase [Rhodococcus erythropolis]